LKILNQIIAIFGPTFKFMQADGQKQRLYLRIFWIAFATPFVFLALIFYLIIQGRLGFMPSFADLENPRSNLASEVISEDGQLLGKFYVENRSFINFDELTPVLEKALLATEDIRFYRHAGIDIRGLARVMVRTILLGEKTSGGGSTITQQLAKNLFPRDTADYHWAVARKWALVKSKFKEWVIAVRLERNYTKKEILVMYLNTVPFGHQSYGIKSAAKTYFNTSPDSLRVEQAALLIGLLKGQTKFSPILNPEQALFRRNIVLSQMNKYGFLTDHELDSLIALPIELHYNVQDHTEGYGTYFREYLRQIMSATEPKREAFRNPLSYSEDSARWASDPLYGWCNKHFKPNGEPYDLYRDGLKIYTTINFTMQKYAEEAVREHIGSYLQPAFWKEKKGRKNAPFAKELQSKEIESILTSSMVRSDRYRTMWRSGVSPDSIRKAFHTPVPMRVFSWDGERDTVMTPWDSIRYYKFFLHAGLLSVDPLTGYVKAYVGGVNFKHFKYDHVMVGRRQVGSTIKPFIYTLAMMEGLSPCQQVPNRPVSFVIGDTVWTPKNSGPSKYDGKMVTLKWGLANSVNYISAWLMKQYNPQAVVDIMRKMGVKSPIDPVPSLVLGTSDITLYEMVGAYGTYPNKGVYIKPLFVTRIEDKNGNVLSTFQPESVEAIPENIAYLMVQMLRGVVDHGTAVRLRFRYNFTNQIAGKTGTTQNHSDGWFCGFTPNLVTGVWVGGEERSIHFDEISMGQGANMALPIWAIYMKKILENKSLGVYDADFEAPVGFHVSIDCGEKYVPPAEGEDSFE